MGRTSPQGAPNLLDVSAYVLVLFPQGSNAPACGRIQVLPVAFIKSFDALVEALNQRKTTIPDAPEIKARLGLLKSACDRILRDIHDADGSQDKRFPDATLRHVDDAECATTQLYGWAKTIASGKLSASDAMTKQAKLQLVPYIAALGYAARIRIITRLVEREVASQDSDKMRHLDRAREVVDDVVALLNKALERLMPNTSLLEVALDYDLPMAMYLTLMDRFRASIATIRSPSAESEGMAAFDDGLASLRDAFQWKPSGDRHHAHETIIQLGSIAQSLWWARFTDADLQAANSQQLRKSITAREIAQVLGVRSADGAAALAIKPGRQSALLQLPPASALRAALCAAIARTCPAAVPRSFARTSAPPPPPDTLPHRHSRWLCCLPLPSRAPEIEHLRVAAAPLTLAGHTNWVRSVAVCPDGDRVVSGSLDGTARLWSVSGGRQLLRTLSGHSIAVNCVAVSPDGKRAVSASADKSVRIWSVESGRAQRILQGHAHSVWAVALSPDGRSIASGSEDRSVKLWNVESGQCYATLTGHFGSVWSVAFSPDGETLVSGSKDKAIRVWDVRARGVERSLCGHSDGVPGVAVTPDGRRVVSGGWDKAIKVWSVSSGAEEMSFEGHADRVSGVAVFPDGQRIASGSWDKSIRVWNVSSKAAEVTLAGHSDQVQCVAVAPDGRRVVSGSRDETIKVWDLRGGGIG